MISPSLYSYEILPHPSHALHFLSDPIQQFFATQDRDLIPTLKRLAYLAERFKYKIVHANDVDWHRPFSIECDFLDAIREPEDLAYSITIAANKTYRRISLIDILDFNNKRLGSLIRQWTALSDNMAVYVGIDISLLRFAIRLEEVY